MGWVGAADFVTVYCPDLSAGTVVTQNWHWAAYAGNSVDIYVGYSEHDGKAPEPSYTRVAAGLPETGTAPITIGCGGCYTVKTVASNATGSRAAYFSGCTTIRPQG